MEIKIFWTNYEKVRAALTEMSDGDWYRGIIRDSAVYVLARWTDYAKSITHKRSGELAASHIWEYDSHTMQGAVFPNPRAVWLEGRNTIRWPKVYGEYEEARGGTHAFYERTYRDKGSMAEETGARVMISKIPRIY